MRKVIGFFIKRPIWGNALIAIIILFGVFSIFSTRRSFFPEIDPYTIVVSVFYPGASPAEMEEGVTIKVEQAVKGLPEIEEINSVSSENMASITLKAYTDTDMDELLSDVENSINSINSFPQGAERPIIRRLKSSGMGSVVAFCGISSKKENIDNMDLTDLAAKVERDLLSTKVITQVEKQGFPEKEIAINVRESDLLRYSISMQEVSAAISSKNLDITTGMIRGGMQEMNIRSNSKGVTDESIGQIILRTSTTGEEIRIADVADVVTGYSEASQESRFNGMPAVSFRIEKTVDQDIAKITAALHDYKEKFNAANPGYQFNIFFEFNSMLNQRIDLLTSNGLTGLVLVLVFLGLFLNIKLSAWVAFGIPFSFLGMFIIGLAYGISINMISLFGMILVVGILVDDGIVIAENIYTHFERGKSASQAAIDGTMEVLPSVFSSVVTTIVAFSILLFVEGLEMMREMAFVVISCLAFSLVEAFIILPAHLAHKSVLYESDKPNLSLRSGFLLMLGGIAVIVLASFVFPSGDISLGAVLFPFLLFVIGGVMVFKGFNTSPIEQVVRGGADKGIKYVRENLFRTTIDMFLGTKRKWYRLTFFFPLFFLIVTLGMFSAGVISFTFFPNIQPDFFSIEAAYRPGDNKEQTERFVEAATMVLLEENERIKKENGDTLLTYFSSNLGFSQNLGQNGNHTAAINVFYDGEKSSTPVDTLMNRIVRRLREIPEGLLAQETYVGGFNRFGKEIEIGLTSSNDKNLYLVRDDLKKRMSQIDGLINVKDNMPPGKVEVQLELLPQAEVFGLTRADVLNQIRAGFFGLEAQRVIIGTDEVKIWVRYPQADRRSYSDLENMRIKTPNGHAIPLNEICDFKLGRAPESLKRRNGQRIIKVDANSTDPDRVAVINTDLFNKVIPELTRSYSDVQAVKLGQFERSQKTGNSMQYVSIIGIVMMFIILTLHFNSLSQAFLILLVLPAGIAGAIMGHGLVGIPVSILSVFGMIGLLGVLVNDAIVFLDRYNAVLVEGLTPREAVMEAAISRFRPILLTSLTTVAGLLPMIAEQSMQAQFLIPMATSIAFGVLFGTIFILFFYPSAILFWNDRARLAKMIWRWEKIDPSDVEPAIKLHRKDSEHEEN